MNKHTLKRTDLRQLCSFILFRDEAYAELESYRERLDHAAVIVNRALRGVSNGTLEELEAQYDVSDAFDIYAEAYTQVGMKMGAELLFQLIAQDDSDDEEKMIDKLRKL